MTDADVPRDRKLTVDELRAWLNRPPPPKIDEREWEEFEFLRVIADNTCMVKTRACALETA